MIIRNAVHCAVPSVEYFSWNSACNNRNLVVMDQVRGRGWGSVEYYYWSHVGSIHIYKLARQIKSQEEKWKTQPNTKKRKGKKNPHWATRQCLLCWETKCNNHTIHRRTGDRIAAIEQVLVLNRVTNIDHNLHVSLIINIRKTKSSIRQPTQT